MSRYKTHAVSQIEYFCTYTNNFWKCIHTIGMERCSDDSGNVSNNAHLGAGNSRYFEFVSAEGEYLC